MKLTTTLMIAAAIAVTSGTEAAAQKISVSGSPHNFQDDIANGVAALQTEADWNTTGEICAPCHTPHTDGGTSMAVGLLWSHTLSDTVAWGTYVSYPNQGFTSIDGQQTTPEGSDKMCLSCHDGTVGLDEFAHNGTPAAGSPFYLGGNANTTFGYDVADFTTAQQSHPISVEYDEVADTGLKAKSTTFGTGTIADILEGGQILRCSSCHDVHGDEAVANTPLLRLTNAGSALCLTCHDK